MEQPCICRELGALLEPPSRVEVHYLAPGYSLHDAVDRYHDGQPMTDCLLCGASYPTLAGHRCPEDFARDEALRLGRTLGPTEAGFPA